MTTLYTIGFCGKDAKTFFELLRDHGVETLVDVRLNNVSQLAGYAKKNDLAYFLDRICHIRYVHLPLLAPTKEILDAYRKKEISWEEYESRYKRLIGERNIADRLQGMDFSNACLLCSEKTAGNCHRRLAAELLKESFSIDRIVHL